MMVHRTKKSSQKINLMLVLMMNVSKIFQIVSQVNNRVRRAPYSQLWILSKLEFSSVAQLLFEYNTISTQTQRSDGIR